MARCEFVEEKFSSSAVVKGWTAFAEKADAPGKDTGVYLPPNHPFDKGTVAAAKHAAERTKSRKLISIAGGGDTVAALNQAGVGADFTYVSTAGGAFLEWMEGKPLPGVGILRTK